MTPIAHRLSCAACTARGGEQGAAGEARRARSSSATAIVFRPETSRTLCGDIEDTGIAFFKPNCRSVFAVGPVGLWASLLRCPQIHGPKELRRADRRYRSVGCRSEC